MRNKRKVLCKIPVDRSRSRILDKNKCVNNLPDYEIKGGENHMLDEATILEAIGGDSEALARVVSRYESIIDKYSMRKKIGRSGMVKYEIDQDVKKSLEVSLIVAVLNYKVR
ncbi:helix-turn-helix domain-containing protein [Anaerotignum sp.]